MKISIILSYICLATVAFAESLSDIREKAEKGDAAAQNSLGVIYQNGLKGVSEDQREAFDWFKKSAEGGDAEGQANLGHMYCAGQGVSKSEFEGAKWLLKAAEQGQKYAQFNIGKCYRDGAGVAKDDTEAYKWFLLSAAQDNTAAKWCIEDLEPKLSQSQREEGQKRAKDFSPKKPWKLFGR